MGLFEKIFKKERQQQAVGQYFQTLTGYTPAFTSFEGSIYEADLTRAAIHAFAKQAAKLTPKITGTKCKSLEPVPFATDRGKAGRVQREIALVLS